MTYCDMPWHTLTFYDSQAVTAQSCSSAVCLLLDGLAGPFPTGAREQEQEQKGLGGEGGGVRRNTLVQVNAPLDCACKAFPWLLHFYRQYLCRHMVS